MNDRIRVPEVRLVGPNGEQVGIVRVEVALQLAADADLDLVEVAPMAKPPVAKLMDFGKYKYEAAMKAREARKNQVNTVIKEIKLRPKIDPHDYGTKKGHVERFLGGGDKVKVTIMFRGREQSRPELGYRLLQRLAEDVGTLGTVESSPKVDGRNMIMVLAPLRKKSEAKAEQRRRRDEQGHARDAGPSTEPEEMLLDDDLAEQIEAATSQPAPAAEVTAAPVAPVEEVPAPEAPMVQTPVEQTPVAQTPVEQTPVVQTPVEQTHVAQTPATQVPVVEAPAAKTTPAPRPTARPAAAKPTPVAKPAPAARPAPRAPRKTAATPPA
ncbi:MAG: translation initiation factor IF-3 [Nostocoides sp.]